MSVENKRRNRFRRKGKNLITSKRLKPKTWHISEREAKEALTAAGCKVRQIKKIRLLKYQICISYWNEKGGVCSGFFSYRIFPTWQKKVEEVIESCPNLNEWQALNHMMVHREFKYFPYPTEMEDALHSALQNRLCVLKQTVYDDVGNSREWEYCGSFITNS